MSKSSVKVGSLPAEAKLKGTINETVPAEQRSVSIPSKLAKGPKRTETGSFEPAAYSIPKGLTRVDR